MKGDNWIEFAREDLKIAKLALENRIYNQTCFHCQQAVEKSLKGYLIVQNKIIPKIHSLDELLKLCIQIDINFGNLRKKCSKLDDYYIPTRYPDALPGTLPKGLPNENDAREAFSFTEEIMQFVIERIK